MIILKKIIIFSIKILKEEECNNLIKQFNKNIVEPMIYFPKLELYLLHYNHEFHESHSNRFENRLLSMQRNFLLFLKASHLQHTGGHFLRKVGGTRIPESRRSYRRGEGEGLKELEGKTIKWHSTRLRNFPVANFFRNSWLTQHSARIMSKIVEISAVKSTLCTAVEENLLSISKIELNTLSEFPLLLLFTLQAT